MVVTPHDRTDLLLAPVSLVLDSRLERLELLTEEELTREVALTTDREPRSLADRGPLVLELLHREVDTRGWTLAWHARGLEVTHADHSLVLGIGPTVRSYLGLL